MGEICTEKFQTCDLLYDFKMDYIVKNKHIITKRKLIPRELYSDERFIAKRVYANLLTIIVT